METEGEGERDKQTEKERQREYKELADAIMETERSHSLFAACQLETQESQWCHSNVSLKA